jgi:FKBP-type peptidyl-prolyl cis-trans isomerase FkpA
MIRNKMLTILAALVMTVSFGVRAEDAPATDAKPKQEEKAPKKKASSKSKETPSVKGLKIEDLKTGDGAEAVAGKNVTVHYTGWLQSNNQKFDSSVDRGQPFSFNLGSGMVIKGWDVGVAGMKVGGKRKLTIQPEMGYGERGAGAVIPPNSVLVFDVELLGVK